MIKWLIKILECIIKITDKVITAIKFIFIIDENEKDETYFHTSLWDDSKK